MTGEAKGPPVRHAAIDFWRGLLLCTIYINHVPGNLFEGLTQKNYGFSDSAEAFVFLSGLSLALAYRRRIAAGEWSRLGSSLARRAVRLYGVHLLLSGLGLAIFAIGAWLTRDAGLLAVHGRDIAVAMPGAAALGVVTLGHQFGYFNILPLYVLLLALVPVLLRLGRASPWPMLAASGALYILARHEGWNLPNWPAPGGWFFDPFDWQFILAVGVAFGLSGGEWRLPRSRALFWLAGFIVAGAAVSVTNGFSLWPGLQDWTRRWADLDKTTLGLGRILHFLAFAYILARLRVAHALRVLPVFEPLCRIGRSGMWIFALLSLLAAGGQVVTNAYGHGLVVDTIVIAGGLVLLEACASGLERRRLTGRRPQTTPTWDSITARLRRLALNATSNRSPRRPAGAQLSDAEVRSIVVGLMMAMLLAALDQTIVATALPTIGRDLGDAGNLPWIVTAYLLASTAVTPLYGKLSDIHGRRITLLVAIVTFVLGSVACALAPSMLILAAARGLQGIGGGGLISLAQTIIGDIMSPRERARYQAYIASVFVASSIAGPLLGGFFAQSIHWSLIFWINLPIGLAAYAMTADKLRRLPRNERAHSLDYVGAGFLIVASTTLLLALSWGGVRYAWSSAVILALLGISALLWAGFVWRLLTAHEPLIPVEILADRVVYCATFAACFAMGTFIGLAIYVPIYFEGVLGMTASQSGLALLPLMLGTVTGATISGRTMFYMRNYKILPIVFLGLAVVACLAFAVLGRRLPLAVAEPMFLMVSIGLGTVLPLSTIVIQNAVPLHQLGTATASMNFFRQLGGALIVAAFGTIVLGGVGASGEAHDMEAVIRGADPESLAQTFRFVYAAAAAGLALALVFLVALEARPLRDRTMTAEAVEL